MKASNPARNISCRACRHRHPANVSCAESKRRADEARARRKTAENPPSDFDVLRRLVEEYAEAYYADGIKGGGDPASFHEIEAQLELQRVRLEAHINKMEEEYPREG